MKLLERLARLFKARPPPAKVNDPIPTPRTYKQGEALSREEAILFREGICPDCDAIQLRIGPSGGMSTNVYCFGPDCGSRFNEMGPFGVERISDASPVAPPSSEPVSYRG